VYNYFLDKNMSEYDMNYALTELKEQHPWLGNYRAQMLQMVGKQVATARKIAGNRLSYRHHDDFNVFYYNQSGFRLDNNRLMLSKIGRIKIVLHRQPLKQEVCTAMYRLPGKWGATPSGKPIA